MKKCRTYAEFMPFSTADLWAVAWADCMPFKISILSDVPLSFLSRSTACSHCTGKAKIKPLFADCWTPCAHKVQGKSANGRNLMIGNAYDHVAGKR